LIKSNATIVETTVSYAINFESNKEDYSSITFLLGGNNIHFLQYDQKDVAFTNNSYYVFPPVNQDYRLIKITGGEDAVNINLII